MEDTRTTNIGVKARAYERVAITLALSGRFSDVTTSIVDRLCTRCAASGRCITDIYDNFAVEATLSTELGCPGWCELMSHLESPDEDIKANILSRDIGF